MVPVLLEQLPEVETQHITVRMVRWNGLQR